VATESQQIPTPLAQSPVPRALWGLDLWETESVMKKLLLLVILGGVGYLVYRQYMASQAEQDLWAEATAAPDLR